MGGNPVEIATTTTLRYVLFSAVRLRALSLLLLIPILVAGFWSGAASRARASSPSNPYLVLIVIDGFRADYTTLAPMRHLHWLMNRGMTYDTAWVGQVEAETPASHATIATGAYPRTTGVIGFGWRDPFTNNFTYMPTDLGEIEQGQLTQTMSQGGVPTISDLIHQRNKSDVVISASGEKLWASAPLGVGADYDVFGHVAAGTGKDTKQLFRPLAVPPNVPPPSSGYESVTEPDGAFATQDDFAARLAVKLVAATRPRALLLNLPATDIAGHYYGGMGDPTDMRPIIMSADEAIGKVMDEYRKLGILDKTVFVVVGDHGMVTGYHRIVGHPIKQAILHSPGTLFVLQLHNSIGTVWLRDPQHASEVAAAIAAGHFPGIDGVLYKVQNGNSYSFEADPTTVKSLPANVLKAYLDLADTEASYNGADVLLPYKEDTTGLPLTNAFHGMHGGFSWGSQHVGLVMAGPGIRHGVSHFPAKLVDIAPTIERLLNLPIPTGVDGVVLADGLKAPTADEKTAQQAVEPGRAADVSALEARSAVQSVKKP